MTAAATLQWPCNGVYFQMVSNGKVYCGYHQRSPLNDHIQLPGLSERWTASSSFGLVGTGITDTHTHTQVLLPADCRASSESELLSTRSSSNLLAASMHACGSSPNIQNKLLIFQFVFQCLFRFQGRFGRAEASLAASSRSVLGCACVRQLRESDFVASWTWKN